MIAANSTAAKTVLYSPMMKNEVGRKTTAMASRTAPSSAGSWRARHRLA